MANLKSKLFNLCLTYAEQRIETAKKAIQIAQASANEETKSSAGDKYETGRAMMQLEIEKNTIQLSEARKLKQTLDQINPEKPTTSAQLGSLIMTDQHHYYMAISAGLLKVENETYFAISPASPVGLLLKGLRVGQTFVFNGKTIAIKHIA